MLGRWRPIWHELIKGDYPPDDCYFPLLIQDDTGDYYIRYWRNDAQWWDHPTIGWLPHHWGQDKDSEMIIIRWAYLPASLFELGNNICSASFETSFKSGKCFATKNVDVCLCKGETRFCDFYKNLREDG